MTHVTVKLPYCPLDDNVEAACRVFDMGVADRLSVAAERGDAEHLAKLLDMVDWLDSRRQAAAGSAQRN